MARETNSVRGQEDRKPQRRSSQLVGMYWNIAKKCMCWIFSFVQKMMFSMHDKYNVVRNNLNTFSQQQTMQQILNSQILLEDDLDYLCFYNPLILLTCDTDKRQSHSISTNRLLHILVAMFAVSFTTVEWSFLLFQVLLIVVFLLILFHLIYHEILYHFNKKSIARNISAFTSFLQCNKSLMDVVNTSLRLIQEQEVVMMGYTLVKPNAPINNAYRIKQRDARECIRLRYCLLKTCITSIMEYREATQTLIQDNATVLGNESLKTDIYLCQIPLKELGPCFHEESNFNDLKDATDGFCTDILRDTRHFLLQQRSEFLRCFTMVLYNSTNKDINSNRSPSLIYESVNPIVLVVEEALCILKRSCEYHMLPQKEVTKKSKSPSQTGSPLYIAVHSIGMHLRAALNVVMQSEEFLQTKEPSNEIDPLINESIEQIKVHMRAIEQCIESGKQLPKQEHNDSPGKRYQLSNRGVDMESEVEDCLINLTKDFMEDQIFEGTTDEVPDSDKEEFNTDGIDGYRQDAIDGTVHVMKELKSVLGVKTSVAEREIRKSKLFPTYKPKLPDKDQTCTAYGPNEQSDEQVEKSGAGDIKPKDIKCTGDGGAVDIKLPIVPDRTCDDYSKVKQQRVLPHEALSEKLLNYNELGPQAEDLNDQRSVHLGFGFSSVIALQAASFGIRDNNEEFLYEDILEDEDPE